MKMVKKSQRFALLCASSTLVMGTAFAGNYSPPSYVPDAVPPNPVAGECYARVKIPAQYESYNEAVIVEDGYTTIDVAQPQVHTRQEQIMVKEASVRYQVRQPSYRTVSEQVMVRPGYDKFTMIPPRFDTVVETVQISGPRLVWKKGNPTKLRQQGYIIHSTADGGSGPGYANAHQQSQSASQCGTVCEIWCLVEEPGESMSYKRKVMTTPAQVQRVPVAPKYSTVTRQVVSDPGGVQEIPVPAEYRTMTVEEVIDPGGERYTDVPPVYGDVTKKYMVSPESYEWRQVVCQPGTQPVSSGYISSGHHGSMGGHTTYAHASGGTTYVDESLSQYEGVQGSGHHHTTTTGHTGGSGYYSYDPGSTQYDRYGRRIKDGVSEAGRRAPWRTRD